MCAGIDRRTYYVDAVRDGADIAYTCMLCLESTRQPGDVQPMVIDDVSTMLVQEPDKEVRLESTRQAGDVQPMVGDDISAVLAEGSNIHTTSTNSSSTRWKRSRSLTAAHSAVNHV